MQVPSPFEYERAQSVQHAIALLERLGEDARVVAGGHSLLPMMKLRLADPEYLVDINDLREELGYITVEGGEGRIGALVRHADLLADENLAALFPIIRDAERLIADPVVRNWGTLGGSLCQADPSEDLTTVCEALDAQCVITGSSGQRVVSMAEFYRGPYETAVGEAELLTEVRLPIRPGGASAYQKVKRRAGDWPGVGAIRRGVAGSHCPNAWERSAARGPGPRPVSSAPRLRSRSPAPGRSRGPPGCR